MDKVSVIAALRPMNYHGHQRLGDDWDKFIAALRAGLQQNGFEDPDSSQNLLLFAFNHPYSAITAVFSAIDRLKTEFKIPDPDKPLPIQIVLHAGQPDDHHPAVRNPDAEAWEMLRPETVYITRPLKSRWNFLMAKKDIPGCVIKNHSRGLARLEFTSKDTIRRETLIAFRTLPVKGEHKECFYCGMRSHTPPNCPTKYLTMKISGLDMAGYIPFDTMNMLYKKVFSAPEKAISALAAGVTPEQLRRRDDLKIFLAYLDINRVYQLRFLHNLTFCVYSKWESVFAPEKIQVDNKNLHLGLDCLRVGQYGRAEELFVKEAHPNSPKRFYATAGLALLALEKGRHADMRTHLEMLNNIALQEKERLYAILMLSKCYELADEDWKARDIIKNAASIKADCVDTQYRRIQLEVKGNFTETAFQQLRAMMSDDRALYMTVLLDPRLAPIQAKVEDILSTQYHTLRHTAEENFAKAEMEAGDARHWFGEQDKQVGDSLASLKTLAACLERGSYFDVLDVAHKAQALISAIRQIREKKLNDLYEGADKLLARWHGYFNFWRNYPFPFLFRNFQARLMPVKAKLEQVRHLAKQENGEDYRKAVALLKAANRDVRRLRPQIRRMQMASLAVAGALSFGKFLAITETVLVAVAVLAGIGLGMAPAGGVLGGLARLTAEPMIQKKTLAVLTLVVAPIIALSLTFRKISNA